MIKGMNHIGVSVSNLDRSIEFYRDLLGMEVVAQQTFEGERYDTILALERARGKVALLKRGNMQIEMFEFLQPSPKSGELPRTVCDYGITHFCMDVADIEGEYERLKTAGVAFNSPPVNFGIAKVTYGRDPDGNVFELLEMSEGAELS